MLWTEEHNLCILHHCSQTQTHHRASPHGLYCIPASLTTIKADSLTESNICGQTLLAFGVLEHSSVVWHCGPQCSPFSGVGPQKARTAAFYALLLLKLLTSHHHMGSVYTAEFPYIESLFSGLIILIED